MYELTSVQSGKRYAGKIVDKSGLTSTNKKEKASFGIVDLGVVKKRDSDSHVIKPQTYMPHVQAL